MSDEILRSAYPVTLTGAGQQTAGAVNSAWLPVRAYTEAVALLNVTAVSGTSPTLDVKFQTTNDPINGAAYDLGSAFAQQTAAGTAALKMTNFGLYLRAVQTVGGSASPTATFALTLVLKS